MWHRRAIIEERQASSEGLLKMVFKNGPQRFLHQTLLGMGGQMMQQMSGEFDYLRWYPLLSCGCMRFDLCSFWQYSYCYLRAICRHGPQYGPVGAGLNGVA